MQKNKPPKTKDIRFMKKALAIAGAVIGTVSPDPAVGAVLVKNGRIISTGFHDQHKTPHAEAFAIKKAGKKAKGADLYINLEPCCHYGNNPPCTDAIIKSGIKRVFVSMKDPNPLVNGRGFKKLEKAGVKVIKGLMEKEAKKLNEFFIKHITTRRPFVILKTAMSLDGKTATKYGESKWITGLDSRKRVHELRSYVDAVMVGIGTVLKDDPLLTSRYTKYQKQPLRIILDSKARTPLSSKVVKDTGSRTLIAVTGAAPSKRVAALEKAGCKIIKTRSDNGLIDLKDLTKTLGKMNISSIMIEGGASTAGSAIESGIVDKIIFFVSPKIIGGKDSVPAVGGKGPSLLKNAVKISDIVIKNIGEDIVIEGYIKNQKGANR